MHQILVSDLLIFLGGGHKSFELPCICFEAPRAADLANNYYIKHQPQAHIHIFFACDFLYLFLSQIFNVLVASTTYIGFYKHIYSLQLSG